MRKLIFLCSIGFSLLVSAQNFKIIPLGVRGGADESNLSSYLISDAQEDQYLALDAGTLYSGIKFYLNKQNSSQNPNQFLKEKIKGYFISHPHFDHSSGLIINSPEDSKKKIYGSEFTLGAFKKHVFVWDTWANFTNEGEKPTLGTYTYQLAKPGEDFNIDNTNLSAKLFDLSHVGNAKSSAILVKNSKDAYFLYLGDTGADRIEKSSSIEDLWKSVAPLIKNNQLKGIAIECSYANAQPDEKLFGHLKPSLIIEEVKKLENIVGRKKLQNVQFIITHIKYKEGIEQKILEELAPLTKEYKIKIAQQGELIEL